MSVITAQTIENAPTPNFAELLRSVPGLNITQVSARDINVTSRARDRHAGDRAARAARRPQPLPGLLRLRDVGLPAGEPQRDQAGRSDPRAGVGGVGRQRAQRRRQRDHQVAARDAGHERDVRLRRRSIARRTTTTRTAASLVYSAARTRRRSTIAGRSSCRAAATRRTRCARPTGVDSRHRPAHGTHVSGLREHGHDAAEVRRPCSTTTSRTAASCRSRAASPAPTASCTPASGRSTSTAASVMGYGKVNFTRKGLPRRLLHQHPQRRRGEPADARPQLARRSASSSRRRRYDFELSNVADVRRARTSSATAATCASTASTCRSRRMPTTAPSSASTRQDEIFLSDMFRWVVGARVDRFDYLDDFVFSPRTTFMIKPEREPDVPRLVQPRLPLAVGDQQLPRRDDRRAAQPRRVQPGAGRPHLSAAGPRRRQPGSRRSSRSTRSRSATPASSRRAARSLSAAFYVNRTKNDIFFTELTASALHGDRTAARTGRCRRRSSPLVPGGELPGALHLPELRQESRRRASSSASNSALNRYVSVFANYSWQGEPEPDGLRPERAEPPAEEPLQRRRRASTTSRFLGNLSVSYSDDAFWQDVLDDRYHGTTEAYTLVNGGFGVRWLNDQLTTSVKVINLRQRGRPAARLRRHHQAAGRGELRVNF